MKPHGSCLGHRRSVVHGFRTRLTLVFRFVLWCNALGRANLKLCRSVYFHTSIVIAGIVHFLYILSTSYKTVLLTMYGLIVKIDNWMDRVLGKSNMGQSTFEQLQYRVPKTISNVLVILPYFNFR